MGNFCKIYTSLTNIDLTASVICTLQGVKKHPFLNKKEQDRSMRTCSDGLYII